MSVVNRHKPERPIYIYTTKYHCAQ